MKKDEAVTRIRDLFDEKGWWLEPRLLDMRSVQEVHAFLDSRLKKLWKDFEAWVGEAVPDLAAYAAHQKKIPDYEKRGIPADVRNFLVGQFDLETRLDPRIGGLLAGEHCKKTMARFLKSPAYFVHYPPMLRFKVAEAESNIVPVHQDSAYNQHLKDFVTVWVPLVDIDDACGGIIVYEGSHLGEIVPHQAEGAWANKAVADLTKYKSKHVHMKAGDALLFPPETLHESAPHRSEKIRYSIDFRVFRNEADTTKSYYNPFENKVRRVDG